MRFLTWNMARNTVGRSNRVHQDAWTYLASGSFDLAFLQETVVSAWAHDRWTVVAPPVRYWGSAIIATPAIAVEPLPGAANSLLDKHGYLAWAVLRTETDLVLGSVHSPVGTATLDDLAGLDPASITRPSHVTKNVGPYRADAAFAIAKRAVGDSGFILAGDWNVSRLWDSLRGITECHEFFERAAHAGWAEPSFRDPELPTWHRDDEPRYQLDHVFADVSTASRVTSVEADVEPARSGLSDHAPLLVDVDL